VTHEESYLTGVGGLRIYWRSWLPEREPDAVLVIAHGAGEHSGRYTHVAARLTADAYAVYALEHRGHGRSEGARGLIDRIDNAVADLDSLIELAAARHPQTQLFLLGHSMGGTIALRYAIAHQQRLAGLILSGALAALEPTPPPVRIIAKVLSALAPRAPAVAVDSSLVSRDPAVVAAYVEDPFVHHGKLPVRTVAELAAAIESLAADVQAITVPVLILYGTADGLCPPEGSVMLGAQISSVDKTIKAYDGLYHEILNEPEQDRVLDDMCAWLATRVGVTA
jgi:acylglycerol lipase